MILSTGNFFLDNFILSTDYNINKKDETKY